MPTIAIGAAAMPDTIRSGLDRYTSDIARNLLPREGYVCFTRSSLLRSEFPTRTREVGYDVFKRSNLQGNLARLVWHQTRLRTLLRREKVSVFYSPVFEGMLSPVCPQVITVHDLLPVIFPDVYPRLRYYTKYILPRILQASAAVIADSESTRADLERHLQMGSTPVHVVYPDYDDSLFRVLPAAEIDAARRKFSLERYVLSVGETRAYKNIRTLITAFAAADLPQTTLAIVGAVTRLDPEIVRLPEQLGISRRVRFLGFVPDEDLALLYSGAAAFAFPSFYEGFGLPPLEAMACGCPVVCSSSASIPEVCGDAALYVDATSTASVADGLRTVLTQGRLRERLRRKGLVRVARFTSGQCAERVAKILESVAEQGIQNRPISHGACKQPPNAHAAR